MPSTTNLGELSNDDLLVQLDELCHEVGARLCRYLHGEHDRDTYAEASGFASAVERAVECPTGATNQYTLFWSKRCLENLAADARLDNPKEQEAFGDFLADHPELGASPSNGKTSPRRLEFTDDDVFDALAEIHASDPHETNNFPCASGVRRLLLQRQDLLGRDSKFDHSDLMLVVSALKRLEKGGRVQQELREEYGRRLSSNWHPAEEEGDDA